MKTIIVASFLGSITLQIFGQTAGDSSYKVIQRTANSTIWQRTTYEREPSGKMVAHVHSYTELAGGLNYQKDGQWLESKEEIEVLPQGGAAATQGVHQAYFPADIHEGKIELITSDGMHLQSRPMGISYDDGTKTVLISELKNSVGELVGSNQVVYPDAFTDFKADLVCTYRRGGFESDVVFREQPPGPEQYGLNPKTTQLQFLTEFFETPEPRQTAVTNRDGSVDTTLQFGKTIMGHGKAFSITQTNGNRSKPTGTSVYKSWLHLNGRTFLVEQLPYRRIRSKLQSLPTAGNAAAATVSLNSPLHKVSVSRLLVPARTIQKNRSSAVQMVQADIGPKAGFVLDYTTIDSEQTDYTFQSGMTYFISGPVNLYGTITIQGGTIIKYPNDTTAYIEIDGNLVCPSITDPPAEFTAADNDSIGESMNGAWAGYTGTIQGTNYGNPALHFLGTFMLTNLNISYASSAIQIDDGADLEYSWIWNSQIINCAQGITWNCSYVGMLTMNNCLAANVGCLFVDNGFAGGENGGQTALNINNCTVDNSMVAECFIHDYGPDTVTSVNSIYSDTIFTDTGDWIYGAGDYNGFYNSDQFTDGILSDNSPFQTAGVDNYYLATNCVFIGVGTTNTDTNLLAEIETMTTYAPQDGGFVDTNGTDLGYHYQQDSDSDGLPDWWEWKYFGSLDQSGSDDYDGDGTDNLDEYLNGTDPNKLTFTVSLGNKHYNSTNVTGGFVALSGTPSYESVLVNSTNFTTAVWTHFDGTNRFNLGPTDGVYQVWFGLKGHADDSLPTWIGTKVYLDRVAPILDITNPASGVVMLPYVQVQGAANEEISTVTYDVSNSLGVVTGTLAYVTGEFLDTNLLAFSTNYFQCYDVKLTNGLNLITIHAWDLAGNVGSTNITYTRDYSSKTSPTVTLSWPTNGTTIAQNNITVYGILSDPTAVISLQVTNAAGTNTLAGIVERDGHFWIQDVPLNSGANGLLLTVTDVVNNTATTALAVTENDAIELKIDPITSDLWNTAATVTGTVGASDDVVTVNGIAATNNGDGTWTAYSVPVPLGNVATMQAKATTSTGGSAQAQSASVKPLELKIDSVMYTDEQSSMEEDGSADCVTTWSWQAGKGGMYHDKCVTAGGGGWTSDDGQIKPDGTLPTVEYKNSSGTDNINTYIGGTPWASDFPQEIGALTVTSPTAAIWWEERGGQAAWVLHAGTFNVAGNNQSVIVLSGSAGEEVQGKNNLLNSGRIVDGTPLPGPEITNTGKQENSSGKVYLLVQDGSTTASSIITDRPLAKVFNSPAQYKLVHYTRCSAPANPDDSRTTIGIGEIVDFSGMPDETSWTLDGAGSIDSTDGQSTTFSASHSASLSVVHAKVGDLDLPTPLAVIAPTGVSASSPVNVGLGTPGPNSIGAYTQFRVQIEPQTVSFNNNSFLETNGPASVTINWPNGTHTVLLMSYNDFGNFDCDGVWGDNIIDGPFPVSNLFNGGTDGSCSYSVNWNDAYLDQSGTWVNFASMQTTTTFNADKTTQQTYQGVSGGHQGPWQ